MRGDVYVCMSYCQKEITEEKLKSIQVAALGANINGAGMHVGNREGWKLFPE